MCEQFPDDVLLDYQQGRLPAADAVVLQAHLAACPACRKALDDLAAVLAVTDRTAAQLSPAADQRVRQLIQEIARRRAIQPQAHPRRLPVRWARWTGIAASIGLVVGAALSMWWGGLQPTASAQPIVATLTAVGANVMVRRDGVERVAQAGMALRRHDRLSVPAGESAVLTFPDQARAELGPETTLALDDARANGGDKTDLMLHEGFLAIEAGRQSEQAPMRIRTPDAEAEVRDTKFTLGADERQTSLRVAEGRVNFTRIRDGQSVEVHAGCRSTAGPDADMTSVPSRPGTVLHILSREKRFPDWDRFNQLIRERLVGTRLWRLGFKVEVRHYHELVPADLAGRALVVASLFDYGVGEEALRRAGLAEAAIPVICLEPAAYPVLGMTGPTDKTDFGFFSGTARVRLVNPEHALSGGLSGEKDDLFRKCVGWGKPADSAVTIACLKDHADRATVFAYEAGSRMTDRTAPARRVGLFLDPWGLDEHSASAWALVNAAVEWCVAARPD